MCITFEAGRGRVMEEIKPITVRPSKELHEKIRKYADEIGESLGGAMCRIAEEFFKGVPSPTPTPSPGPEPGQGELERRVRRLEESDQATQGYIRGLSERVDRIHGKVNQALAMLGVPPT
jgi:hypothetical protein